MHTLKLHSTEAILFGLESEKIFNTAWWASDVQAWSYQGKISVKIYSSQSTAFSCPFYTSRDHVLQLADNKLSPFITSLQGVLYINMTLIFGNGLVQPTCVGTSTRDITGKHWFLSVTRLATECTQNLNLVNL